MGGAGLKDFNVWEVQDLKTLYGRYRIKRVCTGGTGLKGFVWDVQD